MDKLAHQFNQFERKIPGTVLLTVARIACKLKVSQTKDSGINRYTKEKNHLSTEKELAEKSHRIETNNAVQSIDTNAAKSCA
ncbi:MAG: hypothetical protein EZS28_018236 [Streblomastix strix]|uniref:Uncharacterized protein n=1 Tax=Streblomastix strix TaxID=222440 RepID=A0A5J4VUF0_9EUKA|nr:MAG: hypothetical protein EZS28_018236 [Streblomastix strix]